MASEDFESIMAEGDAFMIPSIEAVTTQDLSELETDSFFNSVSLSQEPGFKIDIDLDIDVENMDIDPDPLEINQQSTQNSIESCTYSKTQRVKAESDTSSIDIEDNGIINLEDSSIQISEENDSDNDSESSPGLNGIIISNTVSQSNQSFNGVEKSLEVYDENGVQVSSPPEIFVPPVRDPTIVCNFCHRSFETQNELNEHFKPYHKVLCTLGYKECSNCLKFYSIEISSHLCFKCLNCSSNMKTSEKYEEHVLKCKLAKIFRCSICHFVGRTDSVILKHLVSFHKVSRVVESKNLKTDEINSYTDLENNVFAKVIYLDLNGAERDFTGELCAVQSGDLNSVLSIPEDLIDWMGRTTVDFYCKLCLGKFDLVFSLTRHLLEFHLLKPESNSCRVCQKSYEHPIADHILSCISNETVSKPCFRCQSCSRVCRTKQGLKTHIVLKHQEKHFPCTQCDSAFSTARKLKFHSLKHNAKAFECPICHLRTHKEVYLLKHMDKHVKRFICNLCSNQTRFSTLHKARIHVREIHSIMDESQVDGVIKKLSRNETDVHSIIGSQNSNTSEPQPPAPPVTTNNAIEITLDSEDEDVIVDNDNQESDEVIIIPSDPEFDSDDEFTLIVKFKNKPNAFPEVEIGPEDLDMSFKDWKKKLHTFFA